MARAKKKPTPSGRRSPHDAYESPLVTRYASSEMIRVWGPQKRYATWRGIWVALAEAQRELGLPITLKQIRAMKRAIDDIDFAAVAKYEQQTRHDVMAHIHAFGDAAPEARGIIHLGATSMDVVDNADLMLTRAALDLLTSRLVGVIRVLARFCEKYADLPTLGFTHLQPAQLTTVGKRACIWLQDLMMDVARLTALRAGLKCRGLRGATGTQASFLKLLGSAAKVRRLEQTFTHRLGFDGCYAVCGQTYSRKVDVELVSALASFAAGTQKLCNDIRLLALLKEIEEPFGKKQVGSSAMPYKRNPMRCERATGLARYLISLATSPPLTLGAQMFERTLDDSSNKRLVMPEAFLTADALGILLHSILDGLVVYPAMIAAHVAAELPFIATEEILMEAVKRGGDRQDLHERLRQHSQAAAEQVKKLGRPNDLIKRLQADPAFAGLNWPRLLDPQRHVGLAPRQTREYLRTQARPFLQQERGVKTHSTHLKV
ncbi:MAG: adenylosuccinate lyase [Planctomycetes bacterium]|nr:adenylosuccinate lyase [Planctomycetota bacterium]